MQQAPLLVVAGMELLLGLIHFCFLKKGLFTLKTVLKKHYSNCSSCVICLSIAMRRICNTLTLTPANEKFADFRETSTACSS